MQNELALRSKDMQNELDLGSGYTQKELDFKLNMFAFFCLIKLNGFSQFFVKKGLEIVKPSLKDPTIKFVIQNCKAARDK